MVRKTGGTRPDQLAVGRELLTFRAGIPGLNIREVLPGCATGIASDAMINVFNGGWEWLEKLPR